jgi:carbonic anhydrase
MAGDILADLLARNDRHVGSLGAGYFDAVQDGQSPAAVSVCCADSRVPQDGMFAVEEPGWLFTAATIGNQAWDLVDGDRVVDGNVLYPLVHAGTDVAVVVGHTQCGAVTAAYEAVTDGPGDPPAGIGKWVDLLVPVVEEAIEAGIAADRGDEAAVDRLVEYNVDRQVAFLRERPEVPDGTDVYGFVYDFTGRYGGDRGRAYLTNADGERDVSALRERVPGEYRDMVQRLTEGKVVGQLVG